MSLYYSSDSDAWTNGKPRSRRPKRQKVEKRLTHRMKREVSWVEPGPSLSFGPLLDVLDKCAAIPDPRYEELAQEFLPEYLHDRKLDQHWQSERDEDNQILRPPTYSEALSLTRKAGTPDSVPKAIALRKLKMQQKRRLIGGPEQRASFVSVTPLPPTQYAPPVNPQIIEALYAIRTTPYENTFLSRINGSIRAKTAGLISVDWETTSLWMELMSDIRSHYALLHPERDQPNETSAAIEYSSLQPQHLPQIHDLLTRVFWAGIDVTDALNYNPERCTVVATYKRLVVGVAILSSPQETYITYLAVKTGWDNSQIATTMLYHLIMLNPNKDITLHVSVNNPAMLLYNRFGFKAEEFIVGFYEDYLDPQSRASKNAFRLRLRR